MSRLLIVSLAIGCSGKPAETPPPPPPADAAIDGITNLPETDPEAGHLDDDPAGSGTTAPRVARRPGRPIEITLRSQPGKATAYIDGVLIGPTPQFWQGEANGHEHTFTFTLKNYATVIYRFVPVQSGVLHARLEPVVGNEDVDAGVPTPPTKPTTRITPPAPPPTVVTPKPDAPPPADAQLGAGSLDAPPSGVGPHP